MKKGIGIKKSKMLLNSVMREYQSLLPHLDEQQRKEDVLQICSFIDSHIQGAKGDMLTRDNDLINKTIKHQNI